MFSFELLTPLTYWILIFFWGYILYFSFRESRAPRHTNTAIYILLIVLAIDAFRSLFESVYFGAWYTARVGLIPNYVYEFLVQPEMVIIPKLINLAAASLVLFLLLKRLIPSIVQEHERDQEQIERLNLEIAERKQAEASIRAIDEKLKYEVNVKNRFFSIIAHDLKSPFNSLLGLTEMMSQMSESFSKEKLVEYAKLVNESGNRTFDLVQNLLEWSRLQMEGSVPEPESFSLREVVQECIDIQLPIALEKNIALTNKVKSTEAFADRNMALTVTRNLIANALKFTPSGETVEVTAQKTDGMAHITVTDTGVGMTEDQVSKIFKLDEKTTTVGTAGERGTGLGLPLCKEMVERNGGEIWVESTLGEGAQFHFTLPIKAREK